jgi:fructokinase
MIVVAGEALVDLVTRADGSVLARLGGGPYNVARTIGRLGRPVSFLGMLSTDRFGREFRQQLADDGVDHHDSLLTEAPTTLAVAELDGSGSASYRFYTEGTSAPALTAVPDGWRAPAAVQTGTLGLVLTPMADTIMAYLAGLPDDTIVMLDPNCRPNIVPSRAAYLTTIDAAYRHADVVKVSVDDIEYLAPGSNPLDYAATVLACGPRAVLVTGGGASSWAVTAQGAEELLPPPIEVVDTIGAGDSFAGSFLTWWLDHDLAAADLTQLAPVAAATVAAQEVAAFTCRQVGAQPPRRAQLSAAWHD